MKYKLLIFDLDGTAIPNRPDGMPRDNLVNVVKQLQGKMKVCAATGRPRFNSMPIIKKLNLKDPCIISGGTQIIDPTSEKILWEKDIDRAQVEEIRKIILPYEAKVFFSDDEISAPPNEKIVKGAERIIYAVRVSKKDTEEIMEKLSTIKSIIAHKVISWTPDHYDIHITHLEATKKHAMEILLDMLNIKRDKVIAAGDSSNDLPLFELSGYKIAMENGMDVVKEKADFIAGRADEDGLSIALRQVLLDS